MSFTHLQFFDVFAGGGSERQRNRSPDDSSDESNHVSNARSNENHRVNSKKPRPNEKMNNSHGDDTDNDSDVNDGDLVVDVSNDEDSRSPIPSRTHQQNGEIPKEPEREPEPNHHTKKSHDRPHSPRSGRSSASSSTSSKREINGKL